MDLEIIVSREAHLIAELYDLFHAFGDVKNPIYLLYHGESSKLLYYGSLIEEKGLWDEVFRSIIGLSTSNQVCGIIEALRGINVYKWDEIKERLNKHGVELVRVYRDRRDKIREMIGRILGIEKFFNKIYVILAYNPLRGLIGSLPYYDDKKGYAIIDLFIGPGVTPEKTLDLAIHELLHGLIRINELDIPDEIEEEFIDTLCPEGYLSRELGLSEELNIEESRLAVIIGKYFDEKHYMVGTLVDYLKKYYNGNYLL